MPVIFLNASRVITGRIKFKLTPDSEEVETSGLTSSTKERVESPIECFPRLAKYEIIVDGVYRGSDPESREVIQPVESPKRVGMMSKDMPARDADVCVESLIGYHQSSEECETKSDLLSGKSQLEKLRPLPQC